MIDLTRRATREDWVCGDGDGRTDGLRADTWMLDSTVQEEMLLVSRGKRGCGQSQVPMFPFYGTSTAVLACDRSSVCGWSSLQAVSSLASLDSRVSSLKGPVTHCRAVECRHVQPGPRPELGGPASFPRVLAAQWPRNRWATTTGLFLSLLLVLTDCRLAPARLAK